MLNLYDADGKIQFDKDREAARQYFLQHVNQNTVFFHDLDEKLDYLVEENYYEPEVLAKYDREFVKGLFKHAYDKKFRFPTFLGGVQVLHELHAQDLRRQALPGALRGSCLHGGADAGRRRQGTGP